MESFEKCDKLCHITLKNMIILTVEVRIMFVFPNIPLKNMIIQVRIMIHNTDNVWSGVYSLCLLPAYPLPTTYLLHLHPYQRDDDHLASHQINDQQLATP